MEIRKGRILVASGKLFLQTNKVGVDPLAAAFDIERNKFRSSHGLTEIKSEHFLLFALLSHIEPSLRIGTNNESPAEIIAMSRAIP